MSKLQTLVFEEHLTPGMLCPKCGSPMTTGIKVGHTWQVLPHCSQCDFVVTNGDIPEHDCVIANPGLSLGIYKLTASGRYTWGYLPVPYKATLEFVLKPQPKETFGELERRAAIICDALNVDYG